MMRTVRKQKKKYKEKFGLMDSLKSFPSLFELLWYSRNPCFDVAELTSDKIHEKSVIKQCLWKGEAINTYRKYPTCCIVTKSDNTIHHDVKICGCIQNFQNIGRS